MAIGAEDYIDRLLVKKYSQMQVDNHDMTGSMVRPEEMMKAMQDYATVKRNMTALNQKLSAACYAINAMSATYRRGATLET